ncbi:MAG: glycosyltransferase [Deltaproteobacteria bacterium]
MKQKVEKAVLGKCYTPYIDQYRQCYNRNIDLLRNYPYIVDRDYPDFDELNYKFIKCSDSNFVIYDNKKNCFTFNLDLKIQQDLCGCSNKEVVLLVDEFRIANILAFKERTRDPHLFLWADIPLYLFYRNFEDFIQCMQLYDLSPVLESQRVVFIFGMKELTQYFYDPQSLPPVRLFNVQNNDEVTQFFIGYRDYIPEEINKLKHSINDYYGSISRENILDKIQDGKPRILFLTSRFTTALQYYTRDCALACERLGIQTRVLLEQSNMHVNSEYSCLKIIDDFKPDIIFQIDHFRWEWPYIPENLVFVTWVQDLLPNISSRESALRLGPLDFILNALVTNIDYLLDHGYNRDVIIEGPIGGNPHIYKDYSLNESEKETYNTDICLFSNAGNPQKGLDKILYMLRDSPISDLLAKIFKSAYREMYESFYNEEIIYSLDDYIKFIMKYFEQNNIAAPEGMVATIAEQWRLEVGFRILRSVPLEWLHERGYNMKIWGSEWVDHPVLGQYAQGVAANGETLSKIIKASKIILGTNPGITTHPRVFESILSNRFYLGYAMPEKEDWANIRKYLQEDEDIVFAYSREDLYKKLDYYLENEEARVKTVSNARKKIMEHLTYEALMTRMLKELADKLSQ